MEGHACRRFSLGLALILLLQLLSMVTARADDPVGPPVDVWVGTDPGQVTIDAQTGGSSGGASGTGTQASGGGPQCYLKEVPGDDMDEDLTMEYFARRMLDAPYYLICDGKIQGIEWIPIDLGQPGPPGTKQDPSEIAMHLRDHMPIPQVTVDINPGKGVVGVESWFWISGYAGTPITRSTNAFGELIEVQGAVTRYEWLFGDGTKLTSESPGHAYPDRSEIRHVYQRSSAGATDGYPVDVTFVFAVRYRVAGGPWITLPGITRTARADYPVRESQAVIQR